MDEDKLTDLFKFDTEIEADGNITIPTSELKNLKQNGFDQVEIIVRGDAQTAASKFGFDKELFEAIKLKQSLPEKTVLDFLSSKGKLNSRKI